MQLDVLAATRLHRQHVAVDGLGGAANPRRRRRLLRDRQQRRRGDRGEYDKGTNERGTTNGHEGISGQSVFKRMPVPNLIRGGNRFAVRKRVKSRIQRPASIPSKRKRLWVSSSIGHRRVPDIPAQTFVRSASTSC